MSAHKHTPGPWAVRYDYVVQAPAYEDGRLVPVAQPYGVNCDGTDLFANARLIAAAPELLEALSSLLPHVEHHESCGDHDAYNNAEVQTCGCGLDAAVECAHAAIAKAMGEPA